MRIKISDEKLRSPNLTPFIKRAKGVPMEEALKRAKDNGFAISSNKSLYSALLEGNEFWKIKGALSCWTGTMVGYEKPDQKLGKTIIYTDSDTGIRYIFPVPEEYQGRRNLALVSEHPKFRLVKEKKDRIVQASDIGAVIDFPTSNSPKRGGDGYTGDPKYDIPQGDAFEKNDDNLSLYRFLSRIEKRVGLAVRSGNGESARCVYLNHAPSTPFGVITEQFSPVTGASTQELRELCNLSIAEVELQLVDPKYLKATRRLLRILSSNF